MSGGEAVAAAGKVIVEQQQVKQRARAKVALGSCGVCPYERYERDQSDETCLPRQPSAGCKFASVCTATAASHVCVFTFCFAPAGYVKSRFFAPRSKAKYDIQFGDFFGLPEKGPKVLIAARRNL